jgi:hypothetical protein
MTSDYNTIYSWFLKNVEDYKLATLPEDNIRELMLGWFKGVLAYPHVARLFTEFSLDDETQTFTYTLDTVTNDLADELFVLSVLSKGMLIEWLTPKVDSITNIAQMYGEKEQKFYSQANHLSELRALLQDNEVSLRKLIRDRGFLHNSYIDEG